MLLIIFRVFYLLLLSAALYAGLRPQPVPQMVSNIDLVLHFGVFFAMSFLWKAGFPRHWQLLGVMFLILLGAGIEFWQGWGLPGRTASATDMLANFLGVMSGWVISAIILSRVGGLSFK